MEIFMAQPEKHMGGPASKNSGFSPKMDGENNGKPYFLMDHLGENPLFFGNIHSGKPWTSVRVPLADVAEFQILHDWGWMILLMVQKSG